MKLRHLSLALLAAAFIAPSAVNAAPDINYVKPGPARPMFLAHNVKPLYPAKKGTATLTYWSGSFVDLKGATRNYVMIGTDPTSTNVTTTTKVLLVPIKMVYGKSNGNMTFDPTVDKSVNGTATVIKDIAASPLFKSNVDYVENNTDLGGGKTEYIDAFQRGNFWSSIGSTNTAYHVLVKASIQPEVTITVAEGQGEVETNPFGTNKIGTYGYSAMDQQLQSFMRAMKKVNPGVLPFFVTDNIFLTSGGCCIGGYHNALGGHGAQTYSYGTYVTDEGSFSQDVSALSHELGEWEDDPYVDNIVGCEDNSLMEVGDPLEGTSNYGGYPYTVGKKTYNLQSLVYIDYFGAPTTIPFNGWYAFQNDMSHVCPGQ